jgi:hypothetical protein
MYTGSLAAVSNREDWIAVSPLIDEDGTEVTLTDASFEMFICKQGYPSSAELSGYYDPSLSRPQQASSGGIPPRTWPTFAPAPMTCFCG